jgi:hypothetical protein
MRLAACLLITSLLCAAPLAAWAHGGDPFTRDVLDTPDETLVLTNFGIVRASDPTRYICEEAFQGSNDFRMQVFAPNQWVLASRYGIAWTEDGCDFTRVVTLDQTPTSLSSHAESGRVVATANGPIAPGSLLYSDDFGRSFAPIPPPGGDLELTGSAFLSADEVLVSAYDARDAGAGSHWRVSVPSGRASELPSPGDYTHVLDVRDGVIAGVAADAAAFYVFVGPLEGPFARHEVPSWPKTVRFGGDGALWVATSSLDVGALERGVPDGEGGYTWEVAHDGHSTRCMGFTGEDVLLCARRQVEGHDLTRLTAGGPSAELELSGLVGPLDTCPAGSDVSTACPLVWPDLDRVFRPERDEPGPQDPGPSPAEPGCASAPARAPSPWLALAFAAYALRTRGCSSTSRRTRAGRRSRR